MPCLGVGRGTRLPLGSLLLCSHYPGFVLENSGWQVTRESTKHLTAENPQPSFRKGPLLDPLWHSRLQLMDGRRYFTIHSKCSMPQAALHWPSDLPAHNILWLSCHKS